MLAFSFQSYKGILGFAFWKFRFGRMILFSSIRTVLMTPAMPLAPSKWPTFVLMDPIFRGSSGDLFGQKTLERAPVSKGSPAGVPAEASTLGFFFERSLKEGPPNATNLSRELPHKLSRSDPNRTFRKCFLSTFPVRLHSAK